RMREGWANALSLRYALFVEPLEQRAPKVHSETFDGGVYRAEVRVFDLENGQYLGGFVVSSESDSSVGVGSRTSGKSAVARDFRDNTQDAFSKAVSAFTGRVVKVTVGDTMKWD
ncbi:MAG: hypothetical protein R3B70_44555, partial [Polyangiaceae bacterium]